MNIQKVVDKGLCIGCGICNYDTSIPSMHYSYKRGINEPILVKNKEYQIANSICPAKGYSIINDAKGRYGAGRYSVELGFFDKLYAAHSNSDVILKNASSGGIMTELLCFLLENKIIDKVAATKFIYTSKGPQTITFLTDDINEVLKCQGSKYCPVDISNFLEELKKVNCKVAFLGTPCQIAGVRQIQKIDKDIDRKIVFTIANFCGGFKNSKQVEKISQRHDIDYNKISFLRFRGGGQPGGMLIKDEKGNSFEASYKKYGGFTGYSKLLRCHLCVDATGELADIACGDAWLDKYLNDSFPWSVILTRTKKGSEIIELMAKGEKISLETLTEEEVCLSQRQNIKSKKIRQYTRFKLYRFFGYLLPQFDGGYYKQSSSLKTEVIVYLMHKIKNLLEVVGLYKYFRIIIRKEY